MVAYSFKRRFADLVAGGVKRQTIRANRNRHARPGEQVQLYFGMRTTGCKLLARGTCLDAAGVVLDFENGRVESQATGTAWTTPEELNAFAVLDGFTDWADLCAFWREEHGELPRFEGVLIRWSPTHA